MINLIVDTGNTFTKSERQRQSLPLPKGGLEGMSNQRLNNGEYYSINKIRNIYDKFNRRYGQYFYQNRRS